MSVNSPLDSPADVRSTLPTQILIALAGLLLVFLEGSLATWSIFYASVPLPTIAFIYYMRVNYPHLLSLPVILLMGLFGEMMFFDMLGSRATGLMIVALLSQLNMASQQHVEFTELWANFCLIVLVYIIFRLAVFFVFYFTFPDWRAVFFQAGITMFLFPFFFVVMSSISASLSQLFGSNSR
ncbi:MAG: hypothetical protein ACPGU2_06185 [Candidatus Puniceispirillaceae bacterium]|jgi:cell shape-determining protein MreD|nr:hypothetical protein [Pseudomonadota bacterium]